MQRARSEWQGHRQGEGKKRPQENVPLGSGYDRVVEAGDSGSGPVLLVYVLLVRAHPVSFLPIAVTIASTSISRRTSDQDKGLPSASCVSLNVLASTPKQTSANLP